MPSKKRYYYYGSFDDEVLEDDAKMQALEKEVGYPITVSEDMYNSAEYGEIPEWVDVTIADEGVLPLRMARNMAGVIDGCRSIVMSKYFDIEVSKEWGGFQYERLEILHRGGTYIEFHASNGSEVVEVNITEQFNQAIGE